MASVGAFDNLSMKNINVLSVLETSKEALCVQYTEQYDQLAAGHTDGAVRFYKPATLELLRSLIDDDITENPAPVTCLKHRPLSKNYPVTHTLITTYANGCVKCWSYNFSQCLYTIREKRQTYGVAYHPRLPKFITCGSDGKINLYDEENRIQERIFSGSESASLLDGHTSRVFAACFNPRSNHELITGGWDDVVYFWDARQPFAVRHISGIHMCGEGLDISPKGTEILTCSWQENDQIQVWDYGSGNLIQTVRPDNVTSKLYCGRYLNKDFFVCGGTDNNLFRLIDVRNYVALAYIDKLPGAVYSVALGPMKKSKQPVAEVPKKKGLAGVDESSPNSDFNQAPIPRMAVSAGKRIYQIEYT
ncbi:striatin homolog isoform X2 [Onthophagus taurus]